MANRKVEADVRTARAMGGVIFFQEIGEQEDVEAIRSQLGPGYAVLHTRPACSTPIAFNTKYWEIAPQEMLPEGIENQGIAEMHKGAAWASPTRRVVWVVLKRRNKTGRGRKLRLACFMNTHFVSGAWNRKPKRRKAWRKVQWEIHWAKMQALVCSFYNAGITVIFGGDFNRLAVKPFHPAQRWLVNGGIDKIGVLEAPGGVRVDFVSSDRRDLNSDHDARSAQLRLRVKGR